MKSKFCIVAILITSLPVFAEGKSDNQKLDSSFLNATTQFFSAFTLLSNHIYKINKVKPVDFIFFDNKYAYSTSTTVIKNGIPIKGPNLMNLKFQWKKELHNDSLTLPDKSVIPIGLMSFAAQNSTDSSKAFFVMPLPVFWKEAGVTSKEFGLNNLVIGVFIHEFSHSQQMQNFGAKMTLYEKQNDFGVEFSDDIVQNIFDKDSSYSDYYKKEVALLFSSVKQDSLDRKSLNNGLAIMKERQEKYFKGKYENLKPIDNFFLTMEGLGQYSMFLWLTNPKGGNIKRNIAIEGVRRGGRFWSQDEGFALFLILEKLTQPENWVKDMFGYKTESVISLIINTAANN